MEATPGFAAVPSAELVSPSCTSGRVISSVLPMRETQASSAVKRRNQLGCPAFLPDISAVTVSGESKFRCRAGVEQGAIERMLMPHL